MKLNDAKCPHGASIDADDGFPYCSRCDQERDDVRQRNTGSYTQDAGNGRKPDQGMPDDPAAPTQSRSAPKPKTENCRANHEGSTCGMEVDPYLRSRYSLADIEIRPGAGWRLLSIGEKIEKGDQWRFLDGEWYPVDQEIGDEVPPNCVPYRRKKTARECGYISDLDPGEGYRFLEEGDVRAGSEVYVDSFTDLTFEKTFTGWVSAEEDGSTSLYPIIDHSRCWLLHRRKLEESNDRSRDAGMGPTTSNGGKSVPASVQMQCPSSISGTGGHTKKATDASPKPTARDVGYTDPQWADVTAPVAPKVLPVGETVVGKPAIKIPCLYCKVDQDARHPDYSMVSVGYLVSDWVCMTCWSSKTRLQRIALGWEKDPYQEQVEIDGVRVEDKSVSSRLHDSYKTRPFRRKLK